MSETPVPRLTLHEMFLGAERHIRELTGHLDLDFMPKAESLVRMLESRGGSPEAPPKVRIEDPVLHDQAAKILRSEQYTEMVHARLEEYLQNIDQTVSRIAAGE